MNSLQLNPELSDFSIYITFHQANSIARKYCFQCCVKSAVAQGCKVYLVHDETSNNDELDFAKSKGVELFCMENIKDTGLSKFQKAFELCTTKYLSILQDDDWYEYHKTKIIKSALSDFNQEFAFITTNIRVITDGILKEELGSDYGFITPPSKWVINKSIVKSIDPIPDLPWGWDGAIANQMLSKGDLLHISMPLVYYNYHSEQATNIIPDNIKKQNFNTTDQYLQTLKLHKIYTLNGDEISSRQPTWNKKLQQKFLNRLRKILEASGIK